MVDNWPLLEGTVLWKGEPKQRGEIQNIAQVGFSFDFGNFIFASSAVTIKKYSQVINILIESYKFLFLHRKKFEIRIVIFLWKADKLNSKISNLVCYTQNFKKLNFVCLFSTEISQF